MNWRRGLFLASIHLVVAGTLVAWQEAENWHRERGAATSPLLAVVHAAAWQEQNQAVPFDPCNGGTVCYWETPQHLVISRADFPVAIISAWEMPCPTRWSLAGILATQFGRDTLKTEMGTAVGLCALVFVQWLLVGSFPLILPRQWWWEPGAMITISTLITFAMVLIPAVRYEAEFAAFFALLAWLWWFTLLLWTALRSSWRLLSRQKSPAT
jgi:hypothetical protein